MRLVALFALVLAACASAPVSATGPAALRGCWAERRGDMTVTQRWFPKAGGWQGDEITYPKEGEPDAVRWKLLPGFEGDRTLWRMCMVELSMASSPPCWPAQFTTRAARDEEDRWVEIAATPETLTITYVTGADRAVTYDGRRDGCD